MAVRLWKCSFGDCCWKRSSWIVERVLPPIPEAPSEPPQVSSDITVSHPITPHSHTKLTHLKACNLIGQALDKLLRLGIFCCRFRHQSLLLLLEMFIFGGDISQLCRVLLVLVEGECKLLFKVLEQLSVFSLLFRQLLDFAVGLLVKLPEL